jgi:hypothetical protein
MNRMKRSAIPVLFLLIAASGFCQSTETSSEVLVRYLIDSAAADFQAHGPSKSILFREVHVGHSVSSDGKKQYMLCGEFAPTQETGKSRWAHFVTIKTSGYEQYLGEQATSFCKGRAGEWDIPKDLSSSLQKRFDSR